MSEKELKDLVYETAIATYNLNLLNSDEVDNTIDIDDIGLIYGIKRCDNESYSDYRLRLKMFLEKRLQELWLGGMQSV